MTTAPNSQFYIEEEHEENEKENSETEVDDTSSRQKKSGLVASEAWKYFTKDVNFKENKKATCNLCGAIYVCSAGSTSNLKKHIKKKHSEKEQYQELITNIFNKEQPWKYDNDVMKNNLYKWIINNQHSFTVVEEPEFIILIQSLCPTAELISADIVKRSIMDLYISNKDQIQELLMEIPGKISFTTDIWTSPYTKAFLAITAHYVDKNWKLQNLLIDFVQIFGQHTGENIKNTFVSALQNLSIHTKVLGITTDNASNNLTFINALSDWMKENDIFFDKNNHFRCFAHVINISVQNALNPLKSNLSQLRQLIIKIQHSSQRLEKLSANCRLYNIDDLKSIQDVPIRWNSTYDMIERALKLKEALTFTAASDKDLKDCIITDDNWNQLELIKGFLELFKKTTVMMSGSKYSTLSTTIPLYNELIIHTEEYLESEEPAISNDFLKKAVEDCNRKLLEYYNKTNNACLIATILDPRFKMSYYEQNEWENELINDVHNKFLDVYNNLYSSSKSQSSNPDDHKNSLSQRLFKRQRVNNEIDEFQLYNLLPESPPDTDPLEFWKINESQYPRLANMARDYLAISSTSVPSEQYFSAGKHLITDTRNRLAGKTVRVCMALKSWWQVLN
ncbi:zinc finger BED domain-containing protein RICESLEEPER 2-like [Rhizophagus clarus]|uniref:Zinc finger BED domain-containing protein RICESLEEPER 2-like n=1 Tax=Rhizophagus clarus TaxID=94130 RepID=A0A8H3KRU8_9GLOM|nr:zinc finger BED domain-containing protein RICESLEEPER 2-like [Rhizophagus clarus]